MSFVDRNAKDPLRLRRNSQRTRNGDATSSVKVTAPLTNVGAVGLSLLPTGGLSVTTSQLGVKLADATLVLSSLGLAVGTIAESQVTNLVSDLAGKVPTTRTISTTAPITGGGDLSANRTLAMAAATSSVDGYLLHADWATFNAKVATSRLLNTTAPLAGGGDLSSDRTLSIPVATGSVDGYLSHTDWGIFNGKQPAGSYLTAVAATDTSIAITGANSVGVSLAANSGLQISSGLAHKLADTSLSLAAGGIAVNLATNGGLQISSGLLLKLSDTSLIMGAAGVGVSLPASSGLVINPAGVTQGLAVKPADTSLILSASGVAVSLATNSGLQIGSGLSVKTAAANGTAASANGVLVTGFQQVAGSPTLSQGIGWYDSSVGLYKINPVTAGGNSLPSNLNVTFFSGTTSNIISNTVAVTAFTPVTTIPAGFFNLLGRTIRATVILGGSGVSGTFTLTLQYAGATIWTSPAITGTSISGIWVDLLITTTATGAAGTLLVLGRVGNATTAITYINASTTVNLTTAAQWNLAGQWSIANASNAAQLSYWAFELMA